MSIRTSETQGKETALRFGTGAGGKRSERISKKCGRAFFLKKPNSLLSRKWAVFNVSLPCLCLCAAWVDFGPTSFILSKPFPIIYLVPLDQ